MKVMRFTGDREEYERRAESLIGREIIVTELFYNKGQVLGWRWWFDNHLRAEVLQVEVRSAGGARFYTNIDYVRELK